MKYGIYTDAKDTMEIGEADASIGDFMRLFPPVSVKVSREGGCYMVELPETEERVADENDSLG